MISAQTLGQGEIEQAGATLFTAPSQTVGIEMILGGRGQLSLPTGPYEVSIYCGVNGSNTDPLVGHFSLMKNEIAKVNIKAMSSGQKIYAIADDLNSGGCVTYYLSGGAA